MGAHNAWVMIVGGVSLVIVAAFWLFVPKEQRWGCAIVILGIVALGATVGLHGGLSRVGVVGQIMAAVLGLLGGLVLWFFAVNRADGPIASIVVLALSASVFLAYREGYRFRVAIDTYEFWRDACTEAYLHGDLTTSAVRLQLADGMFGEMCGEIFKSEKELLLGTPVPTIRTDMF